MEHPFDFILGERHKSSFTARVASWEALSGAPASEKTGIFSRRSGRTKTASAWSIYSRDFTRVYLVIKPFLREYGMGSKGQIKGVSEIY